ncbi:two-partner secretion domain-containing protein [Cupriavidus agavae]|uniref:Filamentous hemagglutinin family protein n=1 Tax=Cupriavidus agavae TaxID=1001822 RepID=A0A4Q7RZ70_9BURK|nr:hemagglutinin repeat-containing protein [Cupriavidus agavae]RZT38360.1 filamentous hemagglutinin family protein [Cupriavidus agavae]
MNKHLHRIIFNRHRGLLMAVAEHAASAGKAPGDANASGATPARFATLRPLAFALAVALGHVAFAAPVSAQIVADPNAPGNQRPTVLNAPNGTPLVNIQAPSAGGVSRNAYSQFDVSANGAILNNARRSAQTELGGWVQGNPWLGGGTARVILNEVNSSHPSQLRGYVEVAGDRAQVIIANPAGITCDGCGFLNANRVTMTTGTPVLNGGSLEGYRVRRGAIDITGAGMDASRVGYTDIIARAVRVNAGVWARELNVSAGAQDAPVAGAGFTPATGTGAAPAYALDVSALGGMYAGKIRLVGTEHGLGMRNAGHLGAQAGDLVVTADGRLENTGTMQATSDLRITAAGLRNTGTASAARTLDMAAGDDIDNRGGTLNAARVSVAARSLDNRGGTIAQTGLQALAIDAGMLSNREGRVGAAASTEAVDSGPADGHMPNAGAGGTAGPSTPDGGAIGTPATPTQPAAPLADGVLRIGGTIDNEGGTISAGGAIDLTTHGGLDNNGGRLALRDLSTSGGDLDNTDGDLAVAGNATLRAGVVTNHRGDMAIGGDLRLDAESFGQYGGTVEHGGGHARIDVAGAFDNTESQFASNAATLEIRTGTFGNINGTVQGARAVTLSAATLDNAGGTVTAGGTLAASASGALHNNGGVLLAGANATMRAATLTNGDDGLIASQTGGIDIATTGALDNAGGTIQATGGRIELASEGLDNTEGTLAAASIGIDTRGKALDNTSGTIAALDGTLDLRSGALDNTGGLLQGAEAVRIDTGGQTLANGADGHIGSAGDLSVSAGDLGNAGTIVTDAAARIGIGGTLTNSGTLQAQDLALNADAIDNRATGSIHGATTGVAARGALVNRGLIDGAATRVEAADLVNLGTGRLYGDVLAIEAGTLANREETVDGETHAATIAAREQLDIGARDILNRERALIFSAGGLGVGGSLDEDGYATGRATLVRNASATIESLGDMSLATAVLRNTNEHFAIERVQVGETVNGRYIQPKGDPNRYDVNDLQWESWSRAGRYRGKADADPAIAGQPIQDFTDYDISTTRFADRVKESAPAIIRAGGSIDLDGDDLLNDRSQILAGGALTGAADQLRNLDAKGEEVIRRVGTSQYTYGKWRGGLRRYTQRLWDPRVAYTPADEIRSIDLGVAVAGGHYRGDATGHGIGEREAGGDTGMRAVQVDTAGGDPMQVRTLDFRPDVPAGSLFRPAPASGSYLIETDPRFADYRQWLSSDYLLGQLGIDPATLQKRLGDGFHEQKLVREQIGQLTGRRFLDGHASDEAQYRALLANGATAAQTLQLRPGVALTAAQMAQLTSDIVWLVEQTVTLPNGATARALVPQVYVRAKPDDLRGDSTLIAADVVDLRLRGDLDNAGTIAGRRAVRLEGETLRNLGGRVTGDIVAMQARQDIDNVGGTIDAGSALAVQAGRDLRLASTTRSDAKQAGASTFSRTNVDRMAGLYVTRPGGTLLATAGNDIALDGARIANTGKDGRTAIVAGRDLKLGTVQVGVQENSVRNAGNYLRQGSTQETGTDIRTTGDVTLSAGRDLDARAAQVTSDAGALLAIAGRDATLAAGRNTSNWSEGRDHQRSGLLGASRTITRDTLAETTAQATTFSGATTGVHAGRDIALTGSNAVSDFGTKLMAGRHVNIDAAQNTTSESHFKETRKSGFLYNGGAAFTIGTQQQSADARNTRTTAAASTVGATQGDVKVVAGGAYRQTGSHVVAPKGDIDILARKVEVVEAREASHSVEESRFRQSGLTVAVTAPVIAAIETAQQMTRAAGNTSDGRMQVLAGATTALAAKNAGDAIAADPQTGGGVGVSITVGGSQSQSKTTTRGDSAAGSTLAAGGNLRVRATGDGADSTLTLRGANVSAGENLGLKADGKISMLAAENTSDLRRDSSSTSGGVGVAIQFGQGGAAFGVTANASGSRGKGEGTDTTWTNTQVNAGKTLRIESGGDTELNGAVARGERISADIGGNLRVGSLQDTHDYRSKDQSAGGSVTVGFGFSGSANLGQQKIDSRYASVAEQSGLKAGDGGFDIRVGGNTALDGGVITSTRQAAEDGRNRLDTATLTTSDIDNHADYKASSVSIGGGFSSKGSAGKGNDGGGVGTNQRGQAATGGDKVPGTDLPSSGGFSVAPPVAIGARGNARSTTRSGISDADITIRDIAGQQALTGQTADNTLAGLNRHVSTEVDGSNRLDQIFDEKKIQAGFEIVGALQRETGAFLNNRAREADALKQARDDETDPTRRAELDRQYQDAAKWGPGGDYRRIASALTAAAGGNVTGSTAQFAQSAAVGYLQGLGATGVKRLADSLGEGTPGAESARAALHAIVGCAGAASATQACGAGAMGAATGSLIGTLMGPTDGLSASEKQVRLDAVRSLVAGIAGASGVDAGTATNAATFEGENNQLAAPAPPPGPIWTPGQPIDPFRTPGQPADPGEATVMGTPDESDKNGATLLGQPVADVLEEALEGVKKPLYIPLQVVEGLGAVFSGESDDGVLATLEGATRAGATKGRSKIWEKSGGMQAAEKDFDGLSPTAVKEYTDGMRVGTLADGRTVIVRPDSEDGRPTLEIQKGKNRLKIRY